jgi:acyl-CoA thioesterase-1
MLRIKLKVVSLPSLLLLLLLLLTSGCSKQDEGLRAGFESGKYRTVVAFGDSIVEGYQQPEGWPEILSRDLAGRYPGVTIINAGVSGDTAADGLGRLEKDVLGHSPQMVIVAFGLNDMKNNHSPEQFRQNLGGVISGIRVSGAEIVLLTTTRLQRGATMVAKLTPEPFNGVIHQIARDQGLILIDVYEEFHGYNSNIYLMDVAHPNGEGYRVIANIIRIGLVGE